MNDAKAPAHADSGLNEKRERLLALFRSYGSCAVAFSGGVDSGVAAKAARVALGDAAVAVTGASASLASGELEAATALANLIGIRHVTLATDEFSSPDYLKNAPDRCYHCKTELYSQIAARLPQLGVTTIVNGANADDLGDYRPGMIAASEHRVHSPLAECGIRKDEVRALAAAWALPAWNKPAAPCLSSRVAYGEEVTPERLAMIDRAEAFLRARGLTDVRVRYHRGEMARIEAPLTSLGALCQEGHREAIVGELRRLGFKFITIDLEGFRSGSLNRLIPIESLLR